ncbi:hypothetical protein SO694_00122092 [Aureococcus anophagefferens]|uniref:U-box domain-containing protein n=1 Tax=Aureococcus anophagefferens TaxID=44056 RepID=A0ABR1G384_AURAN
MGAGASSDGGELEQLVACTYLLGQALASMSFPDMYRIQDFHAEDAPALRSARGLAADRENAAREAAQPFDYGSRFNVMAARARPRRARDRDRIAFVFGDAEDPASRVGVAGDAPLLAEGKDDDAPSARGVRAWSFARRREAEDETDDGAGLPPPGREARRAARPAKVIRAWFAKNGSICPLTGQPLVESELKIHDALKTKITNWEVTRTLASVSAASPEPPAKETAHQHDDDLYDF